jgi:hypothetical protein
MANKIEVFVHTNGEVKTITIEDQETIEQLLKQVAPDRHAELELFVDEEHHERNRKLCDAGIGNHHHVHCRHRHQEHGKKVDISINGKRYRTHTGDNSVEHLRKLGGIPATDILSQLKQGKFEDLDNAAHVKIHGNEIFVSHPPSAGSS